MATSKKTASQDTSCVNLQELEEKYDKDLLTYLIDLGEDGDSTTPEKEDSSQKAVPEEERIKTKKIPFLRKHIPQLETLDFEKLEKEAKVKFNEQQRQRILDLINTYRRDSATWAQGVGAGKARERMKDTAKAANDLSDFLSCATTEEHATVDRYWPFEDISPLQFRISLAQIEMSAKDAARDTSPSRGNPGNPALSTLIRRLHRIWTQAGGTGKKAYWNAYANDCVGGFVGPFLLFLQLLLEQAGEPHSLSALHSAIRSALKA